MDQIEKHRLLSDEEFKKQFENCTLNPGILTHEAHLRLAWLLIREYGIDVAMEQVRLQLKQFVDCIGESNKYNETVTVASMKALYHFMLRSHTENFNDFIAENPRLKNKLKELLFKHYRTDIFVDEKARHVFVEPELLPFD